MVTVTGWFWVNGCSQRGCPGRGHGRSLTRRSVCIGDQWVASKICHAIDELDQAIRDIRDTISIASHDHFPRPGGPPKAA
jgi:hypothetical protein